MKQIVLQSQARNQYQRKRALYFVSLLLVIVVGASIWLAFAMLDSTRERMRGNIDHQLVNQAQGCIASLTVWYGGLRSRVAQFADADLVRLFATEVDGGNVAEMLKQAAALEATEAQHVTAAAANVRTQPGKIGEATETPDASGQRDATSAATGSLASMPPLSAQDEQARLAAQLPLMRGLLADFVRTGFSAGILLTGDGTPYLGVVSPRSGTAASELSSTSDTDISTTAEATALSSTALNTLAMSEDMKKAVRSTLETGLPQLFTVVGQAGQASQADQAGQAGQAGQTLQLLLTHALFAPSYMASENNKPVGVLLLSYDASSVVRAVTTGQGLGHSGEAGRLLIDMDNTLYEAKSGTSSLLIPLPDWKPENDTLPLARRNLPDEGPVWARGLKVPNLPWYVVHDMKASTLGEQYRSQRGVIVLGVSAACLIAILLIGMIWWWLIGRQERAVSDELKELYQTVNQQHELLRGINGTLDEGICLFDRAGKLQYANDAFADMLKSTPDALLGQDRPTVFGHDLLERIQIHDLNVLDHNTQEVYTDTLPLPIGTRHCQVSCSPFRNEQGNAVGVVTAYRDITELVQAQERTQSMVHQTINVLVRAIEAVDPYLRGQSMHTGLLAAELARSMGLDAVHAATVRAAANLSHIGMIQLPRELITKAGVLTPDERAQLEQHVEYARASLEGIEFDLPVLEAITQMHERLDGSGYPLGLTNGHINIDAKLLAVANTFCAMMRPRSYRTARSVRDALTILASSPPRYDPQIIQALYNFLASPGGAAFLTVLCQTVNDNETEADSPSWE